MIYKYEYEDEVVLALSKLTWFLNLIQIAENERAQQLSIMQAGTEYYTLPTFDPRNYYHTNMLEAAADYSHHQDQTTLHLGYDTKTDSAAWS